MTVQIEKTPAPAKTPESIAIGVLLPKNFGAKDLTEAKDLQAQFDRIKSRYDDVLYVSPDRAYAEAIQRDPTTYRNIRDFEADKEREFKALHGQMNAIACKATALNAKLSAEMSKIIGSVVDTLVAEERRPFEKFGCPGIYIESPLVILLRKLFFRFDSAAQRTTTTADVGGSPKVILAPLLDL